MINNSTVDSLISPKFGREFDYVTFDVPYDKCSRWGVRGQGDSV